MTTFLLTLAMLCGTVNDITTITQQENNKVVTVRSDEVIRVVLPLKENDSHWSLDEYDTRILRLYKEFTSKEYHVFIFMTKPNTYDETKLILTCRATKSKKSYFTKKFTTTIKIRP
jgi:hypothetical protein